MRHNIDSFHIALITAQSNLPCQLVVYPTYKMANGNCETTLEQLLECLLPRRACWTAILLSEISVLAALADEYDPVDRGLT